MPVSRFRSAHQSSLAWRMWYVGRDLRFFPRMPGNSLHCCLLYGLISLFDGCASTHDLITEAAEVPPTVFIAAENDPDIRQDVATRNKWNLDGEWFCKGASHYRYLEDADQLVRQLAGPLGTATPALASLDTYQCPGMSKSLRRLYRRPEEYYDHVMDRVSVATR